METPPFKGQADNQAGRISPQTRSKIYADAVAKRVIIESPYAGAVDINVAYARKAMRHSLEKGEAPIASHLLYTQHGILKDEVPEEREWGIGAGFSWYEVAELVAFYCDHGISDGMQKALQRVAEYGLKFEIRYILDVRERLHTAALAVSNEATIKDTLLTEEEVLDKYVTPGLRKSTLDHPALREHLISAGWWNKEREIHYRKHGTVDGVVE